MYGKYNDFEMEVQEMVKSFYDPRIEEKGKIEGKIDILIKLLTKKFGEVPESYIEKINKLPEDIIDKVNLDILEIKDIREIEKYF